MKNKKTWIFLFASILSILLLFKFRIPLAKGFGTFLAKRDRLEKCDVVFAPSSRLDTNFAYAVQLLKEGWGDRMVVTTSMLSPVTQTFRDKYALSDCSELAAVKKVFRQNEIPLEKLTILKGSTSSFSDCNLLHAHWEKRPFRSLIVVTDAPHSRRFRMTLDMVFDGTDVKVVSQTSFPNSSLKDLFSDEEDYALFVFWEYIKIVAYILKYAF